MQRLERRAAGSTRGPRSSPGASCGDRQWSAATREASGWLHARASLVPRRKLRGQRVGVQRLERRAAGSTRGPRSSPGESCGERQRSPATREASGWLHARASLVPRRKLRGQTVESSDSRGEPLAPHGASFPGLSSAHSPSLGRCGLHARALLVPRRKLRGQTVESSDSRGGLLSPREALPLAGRSCGERPEPSDSRGEQLAPREGLACPSKKAAGRDNGVQRLERRAAGSTRGPCLPPGESCGERVVGVQRLERRGAGSSVSRQDLRGGKSPAARGAGCCLNARPRFSPAKAAGSDKGVQRLERRGPRFQITRLEVSSRPPMAKSSRQALPTGIGTSSVESSCVVYLSRL